MANNNDINSAVEMLANLDEPSDEMKKDEPPNLDDESNFPTLGGGAGGGGGGAFNGRAAQARP